ncbi:MAG TPA: ABC transporter permease [Thiotrichales bacterium]|nr:ABC transporter permease [Thiotrichales bacterium]
MNLHRMLAVAWKEWREVVRDRLFFTMAFILPLMLMGVLGWGLSLDVENIPFVVVDHDNTPLSRDYIGHYTDSRYFRFRGYLADEHRIDPLLADSKVRLAIVIPPRFQERLLAGTPAPVQALIDGVFPFRAQTLKGYVAAINAAFSRDLLVKHLARSRGLPRAAAEAMVQPVRLETRYLYNQAIRSDWSMAPALIMLVLMVTPPFLTALGVVRERESGSIYNIYASTITKGEFIIGKLAPYAAISCFNILTLWIVAMQVFGAPFKGNAPFFYAASVVYVICTAGIGLLVSIWVRTQMAAVLLTMVITFIPAMLYSGMLVPIQSLSPEARLEAHLFPPLYYLRLTWGTFLKGLGPGALWRDVAILALYATLLWGIGWWRFTKRPGR